jgi:D-alanine-D-alanine ligase
MKVLILHGEVPEGAPPDETDVVVQVEAVCAALARLGHECETLAFSFDIKPVMDRLVDRQPAVVFNLVESINGLGQFIHIAPTVLDYLRLPYTGSSTEAMFLTSNKLAAKKIMRASGICTPPWLSANLSDGGDFGLPISDRGEGLAQRGLTGIDPAMLSALRVLCGEEMDRFDDEIRNPKSEIQNLPPGHFIIKSVWEHASIGLGEDSVVCVEDVEDLRERIAFRQKEFGRERFAEVYIEGREFNLSILAGEDGPEVLPAAEIRFVSYPPGVPKIVDYDSKWNEKSFAYHHTPRSFNFPEKDKPLLEKLESTARECWNLFGLRGYARVDFRVDRGGQPWVLEVNANPCISPDGGFVAAAKRAGFSYDNVIEAIVRAALACPRYPEQAGRCDTL